WGILLAGFGVIFLLRLPVLRWRPAWVETCDRIGLLVLGWLLLLAVSWVTWLIFLFVAIGTYVGLKWLLQFAGRARVRYLALLIPLQLAPLFYFKYADFVA